MRTQIANILFIIAGLLWGIELIPQIIKTCKRKSVKDISLFFYCASLTAYIVYIVGAILIENWYIVLSHIPSFILLITMLLFILKYREIK